MSPSAQIKNAPWAWTKHALPSKTFRKMTKSMLTQLCHHIKWRSRGSLTWLIDKYDDIVNRITTQHRTNNDAATRLDTNIPQKDKVNAHLNTSSIKWRSRGSLTRLINKYDDVVNRITTQHRTNDGGAALLATNITQDDKAEAHIDISSIKWQSRGPLARLIDK